MADNINPIQPSTPSLPANNPPDDKRKDNKKQQQNTKDTKQEPSDKTTEKPHHGLFDEYV